MLMGCIIHSRVLIIHVRSRIYTAWVSALLIRDLRFSQDRNERISKKRNPRFSLILSVNIKSQTVFRRLRPLTYWNYRKRLVKALLLQLGAFGNGDVSLPM